MATPSFDWVSLEYSSKKKTLQDVRMAFTRRMLWSQEQHNSVTPRVTKLTEICNYIEAEFTGGNPHSTVAAGTIGGNLFIATQGFTFNFSNTGSGKASTLLDKLATVFQPDRWETHFVNCVTLELGANFTGIHAEMMIIREVVVRRHLPKSALGDSGLVIATTSGKGCCPNCAGFLNIYRVPHTPVRNELSGMWRHPVSLNKYMHSTVNPFENPPKLKYNGETPGTAIINQHGKVLREAEGQAVTKTKSAPVTIPKSDREQKLVENIGAVGEDDD